MSSNPLLYEHWPGAIQAHEQIVEQLRTQAETSSEMLCILKCLSSHVIGNYTSKGVLPLQTVHTRAQMTSAEMNGNLSLCQRMFDSTTFDKRVSTEPRLLSCPADALNTSDDSHAARSDKRETTNFDVVTSGNLFLESVRIQLDKIARSITLQLEDGAATQESAGSSCLHNGAIKSDTKVPGEPSDVSVVSLLASTTDSSNNLAAPMFEHLGAVSLMSSPFAPDLGLLLLHMLAPGQEIQHVRQGQ